VANLAAYPGAMLMGSITAPGNDVLCSLTHIEVWNEQAPVNWRLLNAEVQKRVRAELGIAATLLAWVWEKQRRGALHKHFVLGVATARERHAAHRYLAIMDQLRGFYGFGFMDRGKWDQKRRRRSLRELSGLHAGRYVAKYLAKRDEHGDLAVAEMVLHRDVPPLVVYIGRRLTKVTGVTMRTLREARLRFVTGAPVPIEVLRSLLLASGHSLVDVDDLLGAANAP
jgi:hypothetical protein